MTLDPNGSLFQALMEKEFEKFIEGAEYQAMEDALMHTVRAAFQAGQRAHLSIQASGS